MILNFEHSLATQPSNKAAVVLIHGLFGSIGNLGIIARALQQDRDIIQVDLRNHGHSARSDRMDYAEQAQDVLETLDSIGITQFSIVGHSMGAKTAMKLAAIAPQRVQQLVVLDMAPFAYRENHHDEIFKALFAVQNAQVETRKQATEIMQQYIQVAMVNQFLLRSFQQGQWLFNVDALYAEYAAILDWQILAPYAKPALFIRGGRSDYLTQSVQVDALMQQFPQAILKTIDNVGHWLHAEQPQRVIADIQAYLD